MLEVKKPFDPSELEDKKNSIENREEEEKPLEQPASLTTEDVHGGEESTQSLPNTPSSGEESREQESGGQGGEEQEEKHEEQSKQEGSKENKEEEGGKGDEENEGNTSGGSSTHDEESKGNEEREVGSEGGEGERKKEEENREEEKEEQKEEDEEQEESGGQGKRHRYNTDEVVDIEGHVRNVKYYQTEFYRFLERFAEERTKLNDPSRYETYDVKRLMLRQYERKSLSAYRVGKVRDKVVLILDNSGSMAWWAENLQLLARLAINRKDVEIIIAPNGSMGRYFNGKRWIDINGMKLAGRNIIYVGDYDGADTPITLSWSNTVVWICPEQRYRKFRSHDWVHYDETQFHGVFIRVYNLAELFRSLKKVTHYYRLWIDLHQNEKFEDDPDYPNNGDDEP